MGKASQKQIAGHHWSVGQIYGILFVFLNTFIECSAQIWIYADK